MPDQHLLDASALLALLKDEPAAPDVASLRKGAHIHAANLVEVMTKLIQLGAEDLLPHLRQMNLDVVSTMSYDEVEACGRLHAATRSKGFSLGDCICLATAAARGWVAVTREKLWQEVGDARGIRVLVVPLEPFPMGDRS